MMKKTKNYDEYDDLIKILSIGIIAIIIIVALSLFGIGQGLYEHHQYKSLCMNNGYSDVVDGTRFNDFCTKCYKIVNSTTNLGGVKEFSGCLE